MRSLKLQHMRGHFFYFLKKDGENFRRKRRAVTFNFAFSLLAKSYLLLKEALV